ncbi:MAG: yecAH [Gammaproteobacteria bacterium]|nr:MAG: yecAH [Gammaproteobacteria bacterium]TND04982.1 MAG: yecAH [Gammaproteobacteria bacterium]
MPESPRFTAAQASRLAAFLAAPGRPEGTMRYCELAGFLYAVACSPDMVRPSEWLPLIFDEQQGGYATLEEAQEILPLIMTLYNHVNAGVLERAPALPPGCAARAEAMENLDTEAALSQWARGFSGGHDWLAEVWDEYAPEEIDEALGASLLVLSFFASRDLAEAYRDEVNAHEVSLEELAGEMLEALPEAMTSYAHMGRALYEAVLSAPGAETHEPVRSEKIGRNDPCPCGSGKKYKKCCGPVLL